MEPPAWCLPYTRRSAVASGFERALAEEPEDIPNLALLLRSADYSKQLGKRTLLNMAMEERRSALFVKTMLENGVPVDQKDRYGRTALDALLQTNVRFRSIPEVACHFDRGDQRRMVAYALQLLARGALPPPVDEFTLGVGNELCARCVKEYRDAQARAVIARAVYAGQLPRCAALIADFLS